CLPSRVEEATGRALGHHRRRRSRAPPLHTGGSITYEATRERMIRCLPSKVEEATGRALGHHRRRRSRAPPGSTRMRCGHAFRATAKGGRFMAWVWFP
ncbi:hypothetical protein PIB30_101348, partial [Stylosanthes scabra]|nr:hypothetical protein [Stylosanthes scabra]